jgi:hypothetical protein
MDEIPLTVIDKAMLSTMGILVLLGAYCILQIFRATD